MFIYSKKIIHFTTNIKITLKQILAKEIKLKVFRDRFYNQTETRSYPLNVVVFNNRPLLGYFDPQFFEIGIHECLMHSKQEQLHNILRHELAHFLVFLEQGDTFRPHGEPFQAFCSKMGWGDEVSKATFCLEGAQAFTDEESPILRKVKKLMALSSSSNSNEAEQAMIKTQQMLLKHNIDEEMIAHDDEEKIILKRIMKSKKQNAKMDAIAKILHTFFVSVVYNRGGDSVYLEILGSPSNVEIAEYVASFLDHELDKLWLEAKKYARLSGLLAKNSFYYGIASGYCNKIEALKRGYDSTVSHALMVLEKKLIDDQAMVYPSLRKNKSQGRYCESSSELGKIMGRNLNINPALRHTKASEALYLT